MGNLTTMDARFTTPALQAWIERFAELVEQNKEELTDLDAAIGDGDHGLNMDRGLQAVLAALAESPPETAGPLLTKAGMVLVSTVGGASGPLYGTFFLRLGATIGEVSDVSLTDFAKAMRVGLDGIVARGRAEAGDKTMYDALAPAIAALDAAAAAGVEPAEAFRLASAAAEGGRDATTPMLARKGRASYLGERSVGHQDPGATSAAMLLTAAAAALG